MPEREHGGDTSSAEEARQEITKPSPNEKQTAVFFGVVFCLFARHGSRIACDLIPKSQIHPNENSFGCSYDSLPQQLTVYANCSSRGPIMNDFFNTLKCLFASRAYQIMHQVRKK